MILVGDCLERMREMPEASVDAICTDPPGSKRSEPAPGRQSALGAPRANHHPCVKPISLMEYLIRLITPPGGTVLDPFAGSGSTGVAAKRLGFDFIGIELNPEYAAIAEKRIEAS